MNATTERASILLANLYVECLDFRSSVRINDFEKDLGTIAAVLAFDPTVVTDAIGDLDHDKSNLGLRESIIAIVKKAVKETV